MDLSALDADDCCCWYDAEGGGSHVCWFVTHDCCGSFTADFCCCGVFGDDPCFTGCLDPCCGCRLLLETGRDCGECCCGCLDSGTSAVFGGTNGDDCCCDACCHAGCEGCRGCGCDDCGDCDCGDCDCAC